MGVRYISIGGVQWCISFTLFTVKKPSVFQKDRYPPLLSFCNNEPLGSVSLTLQVKRTQTCFSFCFELGEMNDCITHLPNSEQSEISVQSYHGMADCHLHVNVPCQYNIVTSLGVCGQNATDKTPMFEMSSDLWFGFGVFGPGLAFCPWHFVPRSRWEFKQLYASN